MNFAVVTLTIGSVFERMGVMTHPSLKSYAARIGADFHVINTVKCPEAHPGYEKLQCRELLDTYDRIIYLDTDILVSRTCPNLFAVVPLGSFGCFQEGKTLDNGVRALRQAKLEWGIDMTSRAKDFFNAGVMVFDKSHKAVFSAPPVFHNNFYENTWLNLTCFQSGTKITDIGDKFNYMCSNKWGDRYGAHIIHYASFAKNEIPGDLSKYSCI